MKEGIWLCTIAISDQSSRKLSAMKFLARIILPTRHLYLFQPSKYFHNLPSTKFMLYRCSHANVHTIASKQGHEVEYSNDMQVNKVMKLNLLLIFSSGEQKLMP